MVRLEDIQPGSKLEGLVPAPVTVLAATFQGTSALEVVFRTPDGVVDTELLFRDHEPTLRLAAEGSSWGFDGDAGLLQLALEARRIRLAHLFDPYLAVHLSEIQPLPHQVDAVYGHMLPRQPLRFALCDDPGAGKTIMAGLYIKEMILRGEVARCLIVVPGGLVTQWQDELAEKFDLEFAILTREAIEASRTGNPFTERPFLIARLDQLARNDVLTERTTLVWWDLIVVDEAHRMAAHLFGDEVTRTKRYVLGERLGEHCRNLLLLTATPHAGKQADFELWLALLDSDRFAGRHREGSHVADTSDLMRRMVKEKLLRFDGTALFPPRRAETVSYSLSPEEMALYDAVTTYVRDEMDRADRVDGGTRTVGFALTVLQRRLASSPEAIYRSLFRRCNRLTRRAEEMRSGIRVGGTAEAMERLARLVDEALSGEDVNDPAADVDARELEQIEDEVADQATAARTLAELDKEIRILTDLHELARQVRNLGVDEKWRQLASLVEDRPETRTREGGRHKLIVFTEHRDTLQYLVERLAVLVGRTDAVVSIHGGIVREQRRAIQQRFAQDADCLVLVATDAAGEGLNLQQAHLMVNYDLPWNPNRLEQRFGRIHRIGQQEVCHLWNLLADQTAEGHVYRRLLEKIDEQRRALGTDQVFDVLGQVFSERPLRELMIEAIRYGSDPARRAEIDRVIDERAGEGLAELVDQFALDSVVMAQSDVQHLRLQMEEMAARRLQPHYVRTFFLKAFDVLGGSVRERESGRYQVTRVPPAVRSRDRQIGAGAQVLQSYERVCFDRKDMKCAGLPDADLIAPGHGLLDSTIDVVLERHAGLLRQGATFVDVHNSGTEPAILVALEHAVVNGVASTDGRRTVVSQRLAFALVHPDGSTSDGGAAPYLDLRPATEAECALAKDRLAQFGTREQVERQALRRGNRRRGAGTPRASPGADRPPDRQDQSAGQ